MTVLVAGFGPFPGAQHNPSGMLVRRLSPRRAALAGIGLVTHVFPTSYATVDGDLPRLVAAHRPQAILLFGLASRSRQVRVETQARNRVSSFPDCRRHAPRSRAIVRRAHPLPVGRRLCIRLLQAVRQSGQRAVLSHDAGRYVCNYALWRALEACADGARIACFVHVPAVCGPGRRARSGGGNRPHLSALVDMAERMLRAAAAHARSVGRSGGPGR